jgi:hypothetical protein
MQETHYTRTVNLKLFRVKVTALILFLAFHQLTYAASFTSFDPRSLAMGGAGVATVKPYNAALFNPSLLLRVNPGEKEKNFARVFAGARVIDRDGLLGQMDLYQDNNNEQQFSDAVDNFNRQVELLELSFDDAKNVFDVTERWLNDIANLSDKPVRAAVSTGLSAGAPRTQYGLGAFSRRTLVLGTEVRISPVDIDSIQSVIDFLRLITNILETRELPEDLNVPLPRLVKKFQSDVEIRGADYTESGISLAVKLPMTDSMSVGVNLKKITLKSIHYIEKLQLADLKNFDHQEHQLSYRSNNIDLGFSGQFASSFRWGLVVRNLLKRDFVTILGHTQHFKPLIRLGLAYETKSITVAIDYDITKNEPLGFDPDKQYIAGGVELRAGENMALRFGYRHNHIDSSELYSAGLGFSFDYGNFDVGVAGEGDELGASVQLGIRF